MTKPAMQCEHGTDATVPCEACAGAIKSHRQDVMGTLQLREALAERDALRAEVAAAVAVLKPSMPESGLVDACRQRMQAYVSERNNAEKLEEFVREFDLFWRARGQGDREERAIAAEMVFAARAQLGKVGT